MSTVRGRGRGRGMWRGGGSGRGDSYFRGRGSFSKRGGSNRSQTPHSNSNDPGDSSNGGGGSIASGNSNNNPSSWSSRPVNFTCSPESIVKSMETGSPPDGFEKELWDSVLSDDVKAEILSHLQQMYGNNKTGQSLGARENARNGEKQSKRQEEKCYKCETVDPNGYVCAYSACSRFVCSGCVQILPRKQKGGKRNKLDREAGEITDDEDGETDIHLCSRCKPQVAYCRRCLGLKEGRMLRNCFFCSRKMCSGCEFITVGKIGTKAHWHACKTCSLRNANVSKIWQHDFISRFPSCKQKTCYKGDQFVKMDKESWEKYQEDKKKLTVQAQTAAEGKPPGPESETCSPELKAELEALVSSMLPSPAPSPAVAQQTTTTKTTAAAGTAATTTAAAAPPAPDTADTESPAK